MNLKQLGILIKDERIKRGWSQSELADIAGMTYQTIIRLEKGRHTTSESLFAVLGALKLKVTIDL